jgi:hypothetical protein
MAASRLEFLCPFSHLPVARSVAPASGTSAMTLFHSHRDDFRGFVGESRFPAARALSRLKAAFKMIHQAIVAAKMRRLQSELMFHSGAHQDWSSPADADAAEFPRRPLILGDKWDF